MARQAALLTIAIAVPAVVATTTFAGCYYNEYYITFPDDGGAAEGSDDAGDAGALGDALDEDAGPSCAGDCVPINDWDFSLPGLLWVGPPDQAPTCPERAPYEQDEGALHQDLIVNSVSCESCSCSSTSGSCALPEQVTVLAGSCGSVNAVATPFDPPTGWDGSCSSSGAIAAQADCPEGSGTLCAQSMIVPPLLQVDGSCEVDTLPVPKVLNFGPPSWGLVGVACQGMAKSGLSSCDDPGEMCVPYAGKGEGFRHCIRAKGDVGCPEIGYTEKLLFFEGYEDLRECSPCVCGDAPEGSLCTGLLSVFADGACSDPLIEISLSSEGSTCRDIDPAGASLGSKAMTNVQYQPGTCKATGGELLGDVGPVGPITFCCLSEK